MEIPVLVEPVAGNGYRARGEALGASAEGATPDEAMRKLAEVIKGRISAGAQILPLKLPPTVHPLAPFAGMLEGDRMLDAWKAAMAENRRMLDEAEGLP